MLLASNGFSQFYEVPVATSKDLKCIDFPSANVGYAAGADSILLKTLDGGLNWSEVNYTGIDLSVSSTFNKLQFLDENIGYASVGEFMGIYKTTDGGSTWSNVTLDGSQCYTYSFYFRAEDNGVVGGTGCFQGEQISIITPTGTSVAAINSPSWFAGQDMVQDIDFYGSSFGMAASRGGRVLRTIDGGLNWDTITLGGWAPAVTAIEIIDDTTVHLSLEGPQGGSHGLRSIDGGLTWGTDGGTFGSPIINDLHDSGDGTLWGAGGAQWAFGNEGSVYERDTSGWWWNEWVVRDTLRGLSSYNDSIVFAVGDSGLIVTNEDFGVLSIEDEAEPVLSLYPNPTSHLLSFSMEGNIDRIRVYSFVGTLVLDEISRTSQIDVSGLQPGTYILELQSDDRSYRRKFVKI